MRKISRATLECTVCADTVPVSARNLDSTIDVGVCLPTLSPSNHGPFKDQVNIEQFHVLPRYPSSRQLCVGEQEPMLSGSSIAREFPKMVLPRDALGAQGSSAAQTSLNFTLVLN